MSSLLNASSSGISMKVVMHLHREVNSVSCVCGSVVFHEYECSMEFKGFIIIEPCPDNWQLCQDEVDRRDYNDLRWKKDDDGYTRCISCGEKLRGDICKVCFCSSCYEEKYDSYEECETSRQQDNSD